MLGNEKLGDTRQETKKKGAKPSAPKRSATIQKTLEEGIKVNQFCWSEYGAY